MKCLISINFYIKRQSSQNTEDDGSETRKDIDNLLDCRYRKDTLGIYPVFMWWWNNRKNEFQTGK